MNTGQTLSIFLLAFIIFWPLLLSAQVHYFDIIPDAYVHLSKSPYVPNLCYDKHYQLDVNFDDTVDYFIHAKCGYNNNNDDSALISVESAHPSAFFAAGDFVDSLNFNDTIDSSLQWVTGEKVIFYRNNCWNWDREHFAGLRIMDGSSACFGWLRMIVTYPMYEFTVVIKDLAFRTLPEESILAGEGLATFAMNIRVEDVGDQKNGADIKIRFDPAYNETGIAEYRIMVVRPELAATFTADSASSVVSGHYTPATANGIAHTFQLPPAATTTDGQPITNLIHYSVFILSSYEDPSNNVLSYPVPILLQTQTVAVANIFCTDNGDSNNGSDVKVTFDKVANENMIAEYRIIVAPMDHMSTFDLEQANQVEPENFTTVAPSGSNINVTLDQQSNDMLGEAITKEKGYYACVLSVADGLLTDKNALSGPSNLFVLSSPDYLYAGQHDEPYIHYIDIEPDTAIISPSDGGVYFDFDLNGDGTMDYQFLCYEYGGVGFGSSGSFLKGLDENNKVITSIENPTWIRKLDYGDLITFMDEEIALENCIYCSSYYNEWDNGSSGYWWGADPDNYTGLIMIRGADTIMGWMKINADVSGLVIKEYAWMVYRPQNNGLPGDSSCELYIYPMPANDQFYIQTCLPSQECDISLYDISGHLITSLRLILVSDEPATIDTGAVRAGIYVLKAIVGEKTINRKIVIMR